MSDATSSAGYRGTTPRADADAASMEASDRRWGAALAVTLTLHLALFSVTAALTWATSTYESVLPEAAPSASAFLALWAFPAALAVGVAMLVPRTSRRWAVGIVVGTLVAAALEIGLLFALVLAYSAANPGWDLS